MVQLESGTTWDNGSATGIAQSVTTGNFSPSNNIWDESTIRKVKLLTNELTQVSTTKNTVTLKHYLNTETEAYTIGSMDLSTIIGSQGIVRTVKDMNKTGVFHAFNFSTTTSNVNKGLQPIYWGVEYRTQRKDNTST